MTLSQKVARTDTIGPEVERSFAATLSSYLERGNLATIGFLAFCYFVIGRFGQHPSSPNHSVTAIWLPAGISLAALLLRGRRVWPGLYIGAFLLSFSITGSAPIALGLAVGVTSASLAGAHLVNKYANGTKAFFKPRDVLRFIFFGAMLAPALCATFGVSLLCLSGYARATDFFALWVVWWVGDMLGILFLTPFLVLLLGQKHQTSGIAEPIEMTVLITGLSMMCVLNFGHRMVTGMPANGLLFLCAPFLVWSALRFCPLEAAGATLVMGGFALWGSLHGLGPFENLLGLPLFVGAFMAVGTAMTMVIAAANAEQKSETKDVLGMYCVLKDVKDGEIRVLQDTVEALRVELARNGAHRTSGSSQEGVP